MRMHKSDWGTSGPMRCGMSFEEAQREGFSYLWEEVDCALCIATGFEQEVFTKAKKKILQLMQRWRLRGTYRRIK